MAELIDNGEVTYKFDLTEEIHQLYEQIKNGDKVLLQFKVKDNKPYNVKIEIGKHFPQEFINPDDEMSLSRRYKNG